MTVSASKARPSGRSAVAAPATTETATASTDGARAAAESAVMNNTVVVEVFGRRLELPPGDQLAFLAGLGVLAALEIIEWPVAVVMAVGHALAQSRHGRLLREFGDALEEA